MLITCYCGKMLLEQSDKTDSMKKMCVLSGNFVTAGGRGKRMCTTASHNTLYRGGGKRTRPRDVPSTLEGERNRKSVPTGGLVQCRGNLVGGHFFLGELDRLIEFADFYAAVNLYSFSSDTDDDVALKPTAHSKKKIRKRKLKILIHTSMESAGVDADWTLMTPWQS